MNSFKLSVKTTAKYDVLGQLDSSVKLVWFVFHGYGMRSGDFIKNFDCIADELTLIVAPEGMHRYYRRSTRGEIGANWMTSDLREFDMQNNIDYLNQVLSDLYSKGVSRDVQIGVVGFSQGCPTAFRWVSRLEQEVHSIIAWGSDIPVDVYQDSKLLNKINQSRIRLVVGDSDPYISSDKVDDFIMELHEKGVNFDFHTFSGGHEIHEETMRYFHARILDDQSEY